MKLTLAIFLMAISASALAGTVLDCRDDNYRLTKINIVVKELPDATYNITFKTTDRFTGAVTDVVVGFGVSCTHEGLAFQCEWESSSTGQMETFSSSVFSEEIVDNENMVLHTFVRTMFKDKNLTFDITRGYADEEDCKVYDTLE